MTEPELQQQRAHKWRIAGETVSTLEQAHAFLEEVGFCLLYPERSIPLAPTFMGAYAGSGEGLPDSKHAYADPRAQQATDLMVRMLRERTAYEISLHGDAELIIAAPLFPYFYALVSDRNPKAPPKTKAMGAAVSQLSGRVFEALQKKGPMSKGQLQEAVGREMSLPALDRALSELWSILKITRVDYNAADGTIWDVLYRWAPDAVREGVNISAPEAISGLVGKYLETVIAASQEEVEHFFSHFTSKSKVREAVNALLAAREVAFTQVGAKTFIHMAPAVEPRRPNVPAGNHVPAKAAAAKPAPASRKIVIAIDGPAGSGKSTLAALLARKYGYSNIESGAMYRALALKAIETGASLDDGDVLAALAQASQIELQSRPEGNRVQLGQRDVTDRIRQQDVTDAASRVSVHSPVRKWMVEHQRAMGASGGIVMEGRDIGTKVFPNAEVKIFLDADPEIRGSRRFQQHPVESEQAVTVLVELKERDHRDRTRTDSPLVPAVDAIHIDSTHLTLEQVEARALEIVDAKLAELAKTSR